MHTLAMKCATFNEFIVKRPFCLFHKRQKLTLPPAVRSTPKVCVNRNGAGLREYLYTINAAPMLITALECQDLIYKHSLKVTLVNTMHYIFVLRKKNAIRNV